MSYFNDPDEPVFDDGGDEVLPSVSRPSGLATIGNKNIKRHIVPRNRAGYVYVLAVPNTPGLFKIGRTVDLDNRLRTFNVKLPFTVQFEHTIKSRDCYTLETMLHHLFAAQRVEGEFFTLDLADLKILKSLTGD
jgi:hypothetical protein